MNFVTPFITLVQIASFAWIYNASEIVDRAQEMGIISSKLFRWYLIVCLKVVAPISLIYVLVVNFMRHRSKRFNNQKPEMSYEIIGWLFTFVPILIIIIIIAEQIIKNDRDWRAMFHSLKKQGRIFTRHSGLTTGKQGSMAAAKDMRADQVPSFEYSPELLKAFQVYKQAKPGRQTPNPNVPTRKPTTTPINTTRSSAKTISRLQRKSRRSTKTTPITLDAKAKEPTATISNSSLQPRRSSANYTNAQSPFQPELGGSRNAWKLVNEDQEVSGPAPNAWGEHWKGFLLALLSYFEQWPERFDDESEEEESEYDSEDSV